MPRKTASTESKPKKTRSSARVNDSAKGYDTFNKINERAFQIFMERIKSDSPGDAISDWLKAEKEIKK